MEKLPQHLENKIFYYLSHPIAEALKRKKIITLKRFDIQKFEMTGTAIIFLPEIIEGYRKINGYNKINGYLDIGGKILFPFDILVDGVCCFGGTAFVAYRFLRKYLKLEHIEKVIIQFFRMRCEKMRKVFMSGINFVRIDNSPFSKLKVTIKGNDIKTIKIYEIVEKCIL